MYCTYDRRSLYLVIQNVVVYEQYLISLDKDWNRVFVECLIWIWLAFFNQASGYIPLFVQLKLIPKRSHQMDYNTSAVPRTD
jgi:hypothetical protein